MVWAQILFCLYKRNKKFYNSVKIDKDSQFVPLDFEDLSTRRAGRLLDVLCPLDFGG